MIYGEFQRQLGKAGVTIREFASLLKMHRNSITNYRHLAEVPTHLAVIAVLMGEMADSGLDFRSALMSIEIVPKKARGAGQFGAGQRKAVQ